MEFSGRLSSFPVGNLVQWAATDRRTGALVVRRSDREKWIYFRSGEITACLSDDPAEFYGRHLLLRGLIDQRTLAQALSYCRQENKRLGVALYELGFLSQEKVRESLRQQIEDSVCDLFLWEHGIFYFENASPPEAELPPLPVDTTHLVLEGTRWLDEYQRIRRILVHDQVVLAPGAKRPGAGLTPLQARVVEAVNSKKKTLREVYLEASGVYFRFLQATHELISASILRIDHLKAREETGSEELDFYDLLFEQAAAEGVILTRTRVTLPVELLERLFPIWVREPSSPRLRRLSWRLQQFCDRLDGCAPLRHLLSEDEDLRSQQVELLLLELRRRNLALLPVRVTDLEDWIQESSPLQRAIRRLARGRRG